MNHSFEKNIKEQESIQQDCANAVISAVCRGVAQANEALASMGAVYEFPDEITVTNEFRYAYDVPGSITYTMRRAGATSKE